MSKTVEEFEKLFLEADRGEAEVYAKAEKDDVIRLPLTRAGFEACLARACSFYDLPVTGPLKNVFIGFVHHIENDTCETTMRDIGATCYKAISNQVTWKLDQEIKAAAQAELDKEKEIQRKAFEEMEKQKKIAAAQEKRSSKAEKKNGKANPVVKHNDPVDEKTVS